MRDREKAKLKAGAARVDAEKPSVYSGSTDMGGGHPYQVKKLKH